MEALKHFLQTPDAKHIKRVFFNEKGEWVFSPNSKFPIEKSVEEVLGEENPEAGDQGPEKVKVTKKLLKEYPELELQGFKVGDLVELPQKGEEDPEVIE